MEHNWIPKPHKTNNWICSNCGVLCFIRNPNEYCYRSPQIPNFYGILEEPVCGKILTDGKKMEILVKESGMKEKEKQAILKFQKK